MKRLEPFFLVLTIFLLLLAAGCSQTVQNPAPASPIPTSAQVTTPAVTTSPSAVVTSADGALRVHYIDVGQGDSILIESPDGKNVLIDGGERNSGVVKYLKMTGIKQIDVLVGTHPHSDHIGGLVDVLKEVPVKEVWINGQEHTTKTFEDLLDGIERSKASFHEAKRGDFIRFSNLSFAVLHPIQPFSQNINNNSIVLKLSYGKISFLFTGDAEKEAEASMLASGADLKANILKVGHHGSRTGSSKKFLEAIQPKVAIYMAGKGNDYGHPHQETITALNAIGAKVYGTDVNGTIVVVTDGETYGVNTNKQASPRAPPVGAAAVVDPTAVPPGSMPLIAPLASKQSSTSTPRQTTISLPPIGPTSTLTPLPTSQITSMPAPELFLEIISVTSPVRPGANATLKAKTLPGAQETITVYYKSGPSTAQGLYPKIADSNGDISWTWKVGTRTTPGSWRIVVTASYGEKRTSQTTSFTVQ